MSLNLRWQERTCQFCSLFHQHLIQFLKIADVEFGTEFPELYLLTLEEATIDSEAVDRVVVDENVIASRFSIRDQSARRYPLFNVALSLFQNRT
jgi:hypothetical protein